MPNVPEDRRIRPHRMIVTGEVSWCKKRHSGTGPRPLEKERGKWHIILVFEVPPKVAADREIVCNLRAGCDQPLSWSRPPFSEWHLVNAEMVHGYKCGSRLQNNEVALLVSRGWWSVNLLKGFRVPCSAYYLDSAQFRGQ